MTEVNLKEAETRLPELINAALNGEEVVITKDANVAVRLVPVTVNKTRRRCGSAKGLITMSDDFDEPLEDFAEYMR